MANREPALAALALAVLVSPPAATALTRRFGQHSGNVTAQADARTDAGTGVGQTSVNPASRFDIPLPGNFAGRAHCELVVDGRTILTGACDAETDDSGGLRVFDNRYSPTNFAMVLDGEGFWNGTPGAMDAHTSFGRLDRRGGCWIGPTSRVCAASLETWASEMASGPPVAEASPSEMPSEGSESTYTNVRYRYSICYPDGKLMPQAESANGDGRTFTGANGVQLLVYGSNNIDNLSAEQMLQDDIGQHIAQGGKLAYRWLGASSFVISTKAAAEVMYQKTRLVDGQTITFRLTYPASDAAEWDGVAARLSACFKSLT